MRERIINFVFLMFFFAFFIHVKVGTETFEYQDLGPDISNFTLIDPGQPKEVLKARLEDRFQKIQDIARHNPSEIKSVYISSEEKSKIPSDLLYLVERDISIKGEVRPLAIDFQDGSADTDYKLSVGLDNYNIRFIEEPITTLARSNSVITGIAVGSEIVVDSVSAITAVGVQPLNKSTGSQSSIVIRFNYQNDNSQPFLDTTLADSLYTSANSTNSFFQEASYSLTSLPGSAASVTPWYEVPFNSGGTCTYNDVYDQVNKVWIYSDLTKWTNSAVSQANAEGKNVSSFDRVIFVFPQNVACGWSGLGEVGGINTGTWINGTSNPFVYSHEIGHNMGLGHANSFKCGIKQIDAYSNCTEAEYGDPFDTMGNSGYYHFNANEKKYLGWLNGKVQDVAASGSYTIYPLEDGNNNTKALRIAKLDTGDYYYIEYRQASSGFDQNIGSGANSGALIHVGTESGSDTKLLDMSPGSSIYAASLTDDTQFLDGPNAFRVTQTSQGASLVVNVTYELKPEDIARSLKTSSSLAFSNLSPSVGETLNASFSLTNTSVNSLVVDVGLADQNTQTGQWNSFPTKAGITFAPGETKSFTFSKTVLYPGNHTTWISLGYSGSWIDALPQSNQLVRYNYYVKSLPENIKVSASMGFSNLSPAAGEILTAVYSLKNSSTSPITLDAGLADINTQNGQWNSFTPQNITIAAGATKQLSFSKKVSSPGSHTSWIAIGYGGSWYDASSVSGQLTKYSYAVRVPNIRLNYYYFIPLPPKSGQLLTAYLSVTNLEPKSITIDALGVPIYNHTAKTWNTMNSSAMNLSLAPNQTHAMTVTQTLSSAHYSIWPSACTLGYCFTPKNSSGVEMFWRGDVW